MEVIDGTGDLVPEPQWELLLKSELEIAAARENWRRITTEMKEREILSPSNGHAIQRLVLAYIVYDRCSREVALRGAVAKPKRGNPKAIARISPHYAAMREAAADAGSLEGELGLAPKRRGGVAKVVRKVRRATAADSYLKPVKSG